MIKVGDRVRVLHLWHGFNNATGTIGGIFGRIDDEPSYYVLLDKGAMAGDAYFRLKELELIGSAKIDPLPLPG